MPSLHTLTDDSHDSDVEMARPATPKDPLPSGSRTDMSMAVLHVELAEALAQLRNSQPEAPTMPPRPASTALSYSESVRQLEHDIFGSSSDWSSFVEEEMADLMGCDADMPPLSLDTPEPPPASSAPPSVPPPPPPTDTTPAAPIVPPSVPVVLSLSTVTHGPADADHPPTARQRAYHLAGRRGPVSVLPPRSSFNYRPSAINNAATEVDSLAVSERDFVPPYRRRPAGPPLPFAPIYPPHHSHILTRRAHLITLEHVAIVAIDHGLNAFVRNIIDDLRYSTDYLEENPEVFEVGSEWDGNPFLFAVERFRLEQIMHFFELCDSDPMDETTTSLCELASEVLDYRIHGPDSKMVVRQRLAGFYGSSYHIPIHPDF